MELFKSATRWSYHARNECARRDADKIARHLHILIYCWTVLLLFALLNVSIQRSIAFYIFCFFYVYWKNTNKENNYTDSTDCGRITPAKIEAFTDWDKWFLSTVNRCVSRPRACTCLKLHMQVALESNFFQLNKLWYLGFKLCFTTLYLHILIYFAIQVFLDLQFFFLNVQK